MRLPAALLIAGLATQIAAPVTAQDPATTARAAIAALETAAEQLTEANGGRDRVRALTSTVESYETGLAALRDGMRTTAARQAVLNRDLIAREAEIGQLLSVLQTMSRTPAPVRLMHPEGPAATARAGMLMSDVTPALQTEVDRLQTQLAELRALQTLQTDAAETLAQGLSGAQQARTALSQAVADRTNLPRRYAEDPIQTAVMLAATETLEDFAAALLSIDATAPNASSPALADQKGQMPLPVRGQILRRANAADAAGVTRPGILVATGAQALVSLPFTATLRYRGPLLNYGLVSILEPEAGVLFVFAGLGEVYGEVGEVLPQGDPIGLMGGKPTATSQSGDGTGEGGGNKRSETLYIEVRENGAPVDPESWFRTGRD